MEAKPRDGAGRLEAGLERGRKVQVFFDGRSVEAFEGESVAAALLAAGIRTLRRTARRGEPRGVYCGMGICFDCIVTIDGKPNVQACRTLVVDGMRISTQEGPGVWPLTGGGQ